MWPHHVHTLPEVPPVFSSSKRLTRRSSQFSGPNSLGEKCGLGPFASARTAGALSVCSRLSRSLKFTVSRASFPASIFERSRMSLMSESSPSADSFAVFEVMPLFCVPLGCPTPGQACPARRSWACEFRDSCSPETRSWPGWLLALLPARAGVPPFLPPAFDSLFAMFPRCRCALRARCTTTPKKMALDRLPSNVRFDSQCNVVAWFRPNRRATARV